MLRRPSVGRLAVAALLAGMIGVPESGRAQAAAAAVCAEVAADEAAAVAVAKSCGRDVVIDGLTSETALVVAEPSGRIRWQQSAVAKRVRRAGLWVNVDMNLRLVNGAPAPVATTVDVRFSRGGTDPLVTVSDRGKSVSLSWPAQLPAPVLDADAAIYAEVFPGVDLRVRATADGFTHVLVVKDLAAAANPALASVAYRWAGSGLSVQSAAEGTVRIVNEMGGTLLASVPAMMWDSSMDTARAEAVAVAMAEGASDGAAEGQAAPSGPDSAGDAARIAPVTATATAASVVVTPDPAMLASAAELTYPLYIDPSFSLSRQRYAWMSSNLPNTNDAHGRAGNSPVGDGIFRSLFQFDISLLKGRQVYDASFNTVLYHSASCNDTPVSLWYGHDIGSGVSNGTRTPWRNDELITHLDEKYGHANKGGGCGRPNDPDVPMEFRGGLATRLQQSADTPNWIFITLVLSTANWNRQGESNTSWWKKFWWDQTTVTAWTNAFPATPSVQSHSSTTDCYKVCIQQPTVTTTNAETRTDGWWRLDGPSGSVTNDSSQRALHAGIYGPVTWSDGAANFAANADLAVVSGGPVLDTSQSLTVSFWAKTTGGAWGCAASQDGSAQSGFLIVMHPNGTTWEMHNYAVDSGSGPDAWVTANTAATAGQWAHVVGIYDKPAGKMRLHINGGAAAEAGANNGFAATGPFIIGRCLLGGSLGNRFNGSIDNTQTYQRALSASEVSQLYTAGRAGGALGASPAIVRTTTPTLKVNVSDPDGGQVDAEYEVRTAAIATATLVTSGTVLDRTSGTTASWPVPPGKLADNTTYYWRARARDEANWYSGWTAWQGFKVDTTAPAIPTSPSTQYPKDQWGAVVGTQGMFSLTDTSTDTAEFEWWVDGAEVTGHATVAATGTTTRTATITYTPAREGPHNMNVIAKDSAGNPKASAGYQFWVSPLPTRFARWTFDEGTGGTAVDTGTGGTAAPAALTGYTWATPGKIGAAAVSLSGTGSQAETTGPVLDTTKSFTVMAWVRPSDVAAASTQTFVSQDGTASSRFELKFDQSQHGGTGGWCFVMTGTSSGTNAVSACAGASVGQPADNVWTHVAGVYDATTGKMRVYVMGDVDTCMGEVTEKPAPAAWSATGKFVMGHGLSAGNGTSYWRGAIDDVYAYQKVLPDSEICQQASQ